MVAFERGRKSRRPQPGGAKTDAQRAREYRLRKKETYLRAVNNTPAEWQPAFPGQRPPFGPDNRAHLLHGANVFDLRNPVAQALIAWVVSVPGNEYLRDERNAAALDDWGHARARVLMMRAYADGQGVEDALTEVISAEETEQHLAPGHIRRISQTRSRISSWAALERAERHERACADRLGLSPLARMKLGKQAQSAAADLALVWAAEDEKDAG